MNPAQPSKTVPILAGGLFLGTLSAIPPISFLNCACCILVIGGGFLASYLYMKDYPSDQPRVTYGDGALLGLLAGLFGAVVDTVISIPVELMFGGFRNQEALDRLRDTPDIPPQLVEFLETMMAGGLSAMGILELLAGVRRCDLLHLCHGWSRSRRSDFRPQRWWRTGVSATETQYEPLSDHPAGSPITPCSRAAAGASLQPAPGSRRRSGRGSSRARVPRAGWTGG